MKEWIKRVYQKSVTENPVEMYASLLAVYGYARFGLAAGDQEAIDKVKERLAPFVRGEVPLDRIVGSYVNYEAGGNGAAYLWFKGLFDEAGAGLERACADLLNDHPRSAEGLFSMPRKPDGEHVWIDTVYAVTPYLTWLGLKKGDESLVQAGFDQMKGHFDLLWDETCQLLHQARGFNGAGVFSQDHWSRGNGWGLLALADVVDVLPRKHRLYADYAEMLARLLEGALEVQDEWGMWHQEMTDAASYPESSGTGLILYALGRALDKEVLAGEKYARALKKGCAGLLRYVGLDGSVHYCCRGCLAPGKGSVEDYKARPWITNDTHAFGPVILALTEAVIAGFTKEDLLALELPRSEKGGNRYVGLS